MLLDRDGKVAVFDSQDAAWNAIMTAARQSGLYTGAKVYELGAGRQSRAEASFSV